MKTYIIVDKTNNTGKDYIGEMDQNCEDIDMAQEFDSKEAAESHARSINQADWFSIQEYERHLIIEIEKKAKKLGLEIESYKVKDSRFNRETVESLRTDTCDFIDFGVMADSDSEIADWKVVTEDEYNSTIYANCGQTQEGDVIVVVIKS